uniref:DUF423 domain-containing protein n=1 Tax=Entomoneis paludosa TaxID=265537 RepID=A0A7S2Y953_9STRA|mmetsp:Transcript_23175/g.48244  ORF Transcript_23175/g.48244 Transcript_23175/m.48244 type:complete len:135 (+) Transcript_23175:108-512(+)|eukprot:CAMPEP_0172457150 /NCGR_PEP_ID=MMETSP1065-20121228/20307_1 /TAXON_ID=265537 /ORGANISM="Amphiprora paludosa, Strain CCMP125" /LENGTH=134 /DNA_ID=CAMNT_0013210695 /DNA_START=54 /DNA_END=458 /DNA_ORIENTATION=-
MPSSSSDRLLQLSSLLGSTGVALGALGAHALKDTLSARPGILDNWRTAILYQLFHATAILGVAVLNAQKPQPRLENAGYMMGVGSAMFSGSIYLLCLQIGPKKILGPTTPLGGLIMLGGWGLLGFCGTRSAKNE